MSVLTHTGLIFMNVAAFTVIEVMFFTYVSSHTVEDVIRYLTAGLYASASSTAAAAAAVTSPTLVVYLLLPAAVLVIAAALCITCSAWYLMRRDHCSQEFFMHLGMMPFIFSIELVLYWLVIKDYVYVNRQQKVAFVVTKLLEIADAGAGAGSGSNRRVTSIDDFSRNPTPLVSVECIICTALGGALFCGFVCGVAAMRRHRKEVASVVATVALIGVYQIFFVYMVT